MMQLYLAMQTMITSDFSIHLHHHHHLASICFFLLEVSTIQQSLVSGNLGLQFHLHAEQ